MSEFMGFHTPDNSCGRGRILPLMCHFELMKWAAFGGLNGLLRSSPGFSCAIVQCISIFLLVSVYICIVFQI